MTTKKGSFIFNITRPVIRRIDKIFGFKSFESRLVISLLINLFLLLVLLIYFINFQSKKHIQSLSYSDASSLSNSIGVSIEFLMMTGNNESVKDLGNSLVERGLLKDLKIYPSPVVVGDFTYLKTKNIDDLNIKKAMDSGQEIQQELSSEGGHSLRTISPIRAHEKCITCHVSAKPLDILGVVDTSVSLENAFQRHKSFIKYLTLFAVFIVIFVVLLLYLVIKETIVQPIAEITDVVKEISEESGDLTHKLEINSRDELGVLAGAINNFIGKIHGLVTDIAKTAERNFAAAELSSTTSEQMAKGAEEQEVESVRVATSVEEMSITTQEVAKNAAMASDQARKAGDTVEKGGLIIKQTLTGIHKIDESTRKVAESVQALTKHSELIGNIVSVIDDVADQTNLLALNAAIEAARAGDQGRGFAVVADEVRKLAERTTSSTQEIRKIVKAMQEGTAQAGTSMKLGKKSVEDGVTLAEEAGKILMEIVGSIREVSILIENVATAAEEQSSAVTEIASNMELVASVTTKAVGNTKKISNTAKEVSRISHDLQILVGKFKL